MDYHMNDMSEITILFVDDDDFIRDMIEHVLSAHYPTHKLVFAVNGLDALAMIDEHHPDIMIVDYYMPLLDGFELCKRVASQNTVKNIIVVSGCLDDKIKNDFERIGINTFLDKPINYNRLYQWIDALT